MAEHTHIEWTDATWNPITGCSVVSPGCTNCYAMKLAGTRLKHHPSRRGLTVETKAGPVWNGVVRENRDWLDQPLRWRRPRRIFVCAHGDLFHEAVPVEWIDDIVIVMALARHHIFQVLTKRAGRMREYFSDPTLFGRLAKRALTGFDEIEGHPDVFRFWFDNPDRLQRPLPNVWLGVSAEDQERADERIPLLLATPAAVRFVSLEPLLGPIDLTALDIDGDAEIDALSRRRWGEEIDDWRDTSDTWEEDFLDWYSLSAMPDPEKVMAEPLDWVILGGENGDRPMHPDWARQVRDQCAEAKVPFFFKQWGTHAWTERVEGDPSTLTPYRAGKKAAGRLLDGVEHNAMPEAR